MLTTRHPVDFPYTRPELEALFQTAYAQDQALGGRSGVRPAADHSEWLPAIRHWLAWWQSQEATTGARQGHTWEESEPMGAFLVRWGEAPTLWQIEVYEP